MNTEQLKQQAEELINRITFVNNELNFENNTDYQQLLLVKKQELEFKLNEINVQLRNTKKINNFSEQILNEKNQKNIKKQLKTFLESSSKNGIITAPTQVGKTNATMEFINDCLEQKIPVILSCDNKTDQLEQIYDRMSKGLAGREITLLKADPKNKKFHKDFQGCLKQRKSVIVFCLDNPSQIEKIKDEMISYNGIKDTYDSVIEKIVLIHDEGDVITKDKDVKKVNDDMSESHRSWIEFVNFINDNMSYIDLKRLFVTATPENCIVKYDITSSFVVQLEIPENYTGYDKINYKNLEDDFELDKILKNEIDNIRSKGENGVILLVSDRKTEEHARMLYEFSDLECIKNSYNRNGIQTTFNDNLKQELYKFVKNYNKVSVKINKAKKILIKEDANTLVIKNMAIRDYYEICRLSGEDIVITIGKDLIARGISYVSSSVSSNTLVARTMIYKPGTTMHAVGICQAVGRLTGVARPDLKRILIAPKDVIETYMAYNKNQKEYLKQIRENGDELTVDVIQNMFFTNKLQRPLDRPKLAINNIFKYKQEEAEYTDLGKMEKAIKTWWGKNNMSGKILKYIYEKEEVSYDNLVEFLKQTETKNYYIFIAQLTTNDNKGYNLVYCKNNNMFSLKKEARDFIDSL